MRIHFFEYFVSYFIVIIKRYKQQYQTNEKKYYAKEDFNEIHFVSDNYHW